MNCITGYYIQNRNSAEIKLYLEAARLAGFIYPQDKRWSLVVTEDDSFEVNELFVNSCQGICFHISIHDSVGWSFSVFDDGDLLYNYKDLYEQEDEVINLWHLPSVHRIFPSADIKHAQEILDAIPHNPIEKFDAPFRFGRTLGFHFETIIPFHQLSFDFDQEDEEFAEVIPV